MDIKDALKACYEFESRLSDKGFVRPSVSVYLNWGSDKYNVGASFYTDDNENFDGSSRRSHFTGDENMATAITEMHEYIDKLPSPRDVAKDKFIKDLAGMVERARSLHLDVSLVNPLEAAMKSLSENVLEHKQ